MRRRSVVLAIAAAVPLLAGCGSDIEHGTITGKKYEAAVQRVEMHPMYGTRCSGTGTSRSCSTSVTSWVPVSVTDPECYRLNLRQGKATGSVCVSPAEYERAQIGGQW